ncbi:putative 2OG-Fe(II) oxygenase [Paractinoplanes maris]|uniref:putative 2OG-Fe(II) oxygenase n=1 Tax=Paractinoplanes maris TaxID=1734446 RepID=UPI002021CCB6|nr:putative 2OG-Fe(II) oxygenase [Actinoplanes maris]
MTLSSESNGAKLLNLFATPAARVPCPFGTEINEALTNAVRRRMTTEVKDLAFKSETVGNLTDWDDPAVDRLTGWMLGVARTFVETVRREPLHEAVGAKTATDVQILPQRSWASIYRGGDHHSAHNHPNTAIAAIYYVASASTCELDLFDPRVNVDLFDPGITFASEGQIVRISSRPGELVLIPGWMKHAVPQYGDADVRISIAWNLAYAFGEEVHLKPAGD